MQAARSYYWEMNDRPLPFNWVPEKNNFSVSERVSWMERVQGQGYRESAGEKEEWRGRMSWGTGLLRK